jgi:mono/diheme cytochrome c family protein
MSIKRVIALSLSGLAAGALLAACIGKPWTENDVHNGAYSLFKQRCAGCHGMKGEGTGAGAPPLRTSAFLRDASIEDIKETIRSGRRLATKEYPEYLTPELRDTFKNMPAHGKWMQPEQLDNIAKWLKAGMPLR